MVDGGAVDQQPGVAGGALSLRKRPRKPNKARIAPGLRIEERPALQTVKLAPPAQEAPKAEAPETKARTRKVPTKRKSPRAGEPVPQGNAGEPSGEPAPKRTSGGARRPRRAGAPRQPPPEVKPAPSRQVQRKRGRPMGSRKQKPAPQPADATVDVKQEARPAVPPGPVDEPGSPSGPPVLLGRRAKGMARPRKASAPTSARKPRASSTPRKPRGTARKPRASPASKPATAPAPSRRTSRKVKAAPSAAKEVGVAAGGVQKRASTRRRSVKAVDGGAVELLQVQATISQVAVASPPQGATPGAPPLQSPSFLARIPQLAYSIGSRIASWVSPQRPPPATTSRPA
eukprot:jgi/Botrbrau1/23590/Bobra.0141s0054.1